MWMPFDEFSKKVLEVVLKCFENDRFKAEFSRHVTTEVQAQRNRYGGNYLNYDALTQGNVNLQTRMAASGYSTYGNVTMRSNQSASNKNVYDSMKNKIHFSAASSGGAINRGSSKRI